MWIEVLKREVRLRGLDQVAHELGLSKSAVSLVCNDKYPAGTGKIEERIRRIYGNGGLIQCPILGAVSPALCVETWNRAKTIGMKAGNPETLRLYARCRRCGIRQ